MAILWNQNLNNLMIGRGLLAAITNPVSVTVFPGAQPAAADITANWAAYQNTHLCHWNLCTFTQPFANTVGSGFTLICTTLPAPTACARAGTATWGIIWSAAVVEAALALGTLPNASFIVAEAGGPLSDATIRLNSVALSGLGIVADISIKSQLTVA
jgi:hypothetical protein